MDHNHLVVSIEKEIERLPQGAADPRVPRWVKRSLLGAGISLTLLGCTGKSKVQSQPEPTPNVYAGPPLMRVETREPDAPEPMTPPKTENPKVDTPPSEESEMPMH